jgi:hypothetical protein
VDVPEPVVLTVDGEIFRALADTQQPGAWHLTWVSGPNAGYGFTTRRSHQQWESSEEWEKAVRSFLAEIDPTTGYLSDSGGRIRQAAGGRRVCTPAPAR